VKTDRGHSIIPPGGSAVDGISTMEQAPVVRASNLDDDIDATRFIHALRRNWVLISLLTVIGGGGSFAIASVTPTQYEASATLVLPTPRETSGLPRTAATARALLTNTGVVSEALRGTALEQATTAADFIRTNVSIDEVPGGQFVRLRLRAMDPTLASTVTKSLVETAMTQGARVDERAAASAGEELKIQLDRAAERLREAGSQLLEYHQSSRVAGVTRDVQAVLGERRDALGLTAELEGGAPRLRPAEPGRPSGEFSDSELKVLDGLSARDLELARLRTNYGVARRVYSDLGLRYEQARADALSGGALLRLVDPEIAAGTALPRNRGRKTMLGLVVGLLAGCAAVVVLEANRSLRRSVEP
jgi:uncharacterized protein involved in exopolysaccharide biosynthesis